MTREHTKDLNGKFTTHLEKFEKTFKKIIGYVTSFDWTSINVFIWDWHAEELIWGYLGVDYELSIARSSRFV